MQTVERTVCAAFTTVIIANASAHASHPPQVVAVEGAAQQKQFVATRPTSGGHAFARQVLPAAANTGVAQSRVLYLNPDGAILVPGFNDARTDTSSVVTEPTEILGWDIDVDTWNETVACVRDIYSRFDVTVTDEDPGDVPHIEALFGGHPADVGLPDNVAGVSPFTEDCSIIENSIVFTFTDVLPDDPRVMCEVMAQEIAHSFGLDHEMLASDPMTYLDYAGPRAFQDEMVPCGEFDDRMCGINGSVCRERQNSVAMLESRLGRRGAEGVPSEPLTTTTEPEVMAGCQASGSGAPLWAGFVVVGALWRRRKRR
jgi:uncharacterized protein (TIGR03382 family)